MESIKNLNQLGLGKILIHNMEIVQIQEKRNRVSFSPKTKVAASLSPCLAAVSLSLELDCLSL